MAYPMEASPSTSESSMTRQVLAWFNDNEHEWYMAADRPGEPYSGPNPQCAACGNIGYEIRGNDVVCVGHEPDDTEQQTVARYLTRELVEEALAETRRGCGQQYPMQWKDAEEVVF